MIDTAIRTHWINIKLQMSSDNSLYGTSSVYTQNWQSKKANTSISMQCTNVKKKNDKKAGTEFLREFLLRQEFSLSASLQPSYSVISQSVIKNNITSATTHHERNTEVLCVDDYVNCSLVSYINNSVFSTRRNCSRLRITVSPTAFRLQTLTFEVWPWALT